jgi:hypothetical protein
MSRLDTLRTRDAIGLARGASGQVIEELQAYLRQFGYLRIAPEQVPYVPISKAIAPEAQTGVFDEATAQALASFQRFNGLPVTGVLDEATLAKINAPRCGFPDLPNVQGVSSYAVHGNRWTSTNITYGFDNFCADIPQAQVRAAIVEAFSLWSRITPLTFSEVSSNPDIRISFVAGDHGDGFPFDGAGSVLAHAYYPPPNGGDIAGDAHFDEDESWTVAIPVPAGTFDLVSVAAHEFGHSLGLMHSSIQGALMYPFYNGAHRFLDQDDISGIQSIYGSLAPTGRGEFYTTEGGAIQSLGVHTNWRSTWALIVPGNFGGSSHTDLLFYDRVAGEGEFYATDGNGGINLLKKHSGWRRSWDFIIPGNFGGSGHTDLLFYDRTTGEAEFYTTDGSGGMSLLKSYSGWRQTWDLIIPGNFGGSSHTDLLFYDRGAGEGEFYATNGSGDMSLLKRNGGWRTTWSDIVPGNFGGSSHTDLLFYDRGAGEGEFYATNGSGDMSLLKKNGGWRTTWSDIVPGDFGRSARTDLLFYQR